MSDNASSDAKLERSAGFFQQDYLPTGGVIPERVIYSALPGIVLTSTVVTATQGRVVNIDGTRNTTVYADLVYVVGKISAPGRSLKIVARKLVFVGDDVEIVTDGAPGAQPRSLTAEPKPQRAADGVSARDADLRADPNAVQRDADAGRDGLKKDAVDSDGKPLIANGEAGGKGLPAGNIEIVVEKWVGKCKISAHGGDGGKAQNGQDGQDAGDGGNGSEASGSERTTYQGERPRMWRRVRPPGAGGRGGDSGFGGPGGAGGNAGIVKVRAVRTFRAECTTSGGHIGCAGTVNSLECPACTAIGAAEFRTLVTLASTGGAHGKDGADGRPGAGGLSGQTVDSTLAHPMPLEIIRKVSDDVHHGGKIGLKCNQATVGKAQILGVYGDGVYCWTDDFDTDKQSWTIERVAGPADGKIRYGDKVHLTNCSYKTKLMEWAGYLNVGKGEPWLLEAPSADRIGTVIKVGDQVVFNHGDGKCVSNATQYWGNNYWYVTVKAVPPPRVYAPNGVVRSKPPEPNPWTTNTKGKDETPELTVLKPTDLCDHWDPAQVWLQIERLKGQYLTLDLGGLEFERFGNELLRWNSLLEPLVADNALMRGLRPAKGPPSPAEAKLDEMLGAFAKVSKMLGMYAQGYDYFGNMLDFAPNPSFSYYANELAGVLADLKAFEDQYSAMFASAVSNETFEFAAAQAFNQATALGAAATEKLESAKLDFLDAQARLRAANARVEELKGAFADDAPHVAAFKAEIMSSANFNCDLAQILQGLEMMVFAPPTQAARDGSRTLSGPGALMAGVQLAKFIKYGLDTIQTVDGQTIDRSHILMSVEQLDKGLFASAKQIFTASTGKKYDIGGPGILATLDRWEELVAQFINLKSASDLEHDIRALADAVRVRGAAVTEFNSKLMDVLFLAKTAADADAQRAKSLEAAASLNDPGLPAVLSFLTRHHQARKDAAIELVYLANRAYANWMLDDGSARIPAKDGSTHGTNVFREVLVAPELWQNQSGDVYGAINWAVLDTCRAKLDEWFRSDITAHSGSPQPFGSLDASGEQIIITDAPVLDAFRKLRPYGKKKAVHKAAITISEHGLRGTYTNEHLRGFSNIRLTAFRVFLNGAFRATGHADQRIQIEFIHDSSDQYFTESSELRTFTRPALDPKTFMYNGARDSERYVRDAKGNLTDKFVDGYIHMDGLLGPGDTPGNYAAGDKNAIYAGVGPFTLWTLVVDPDLNPGLDLSGLTSIEIQLVGVARTRKLTSMLSAGSVQHTQNEGILQ